MKAQKIFVKFSILLLILLAVPNTGISASSDDGTLASKTLEAVESAEQELALGGISGDGFLRLKNKAGEFEAKLKNQVNISSAKLEAIKAQLEALGPAPNAEKGVIEAPDLAQSRQEINDTLRKNQAELAELKLAVVRISELKEKLNEASEQQFVTNLITRQPSVFSLTFWNLDASALQKVAQDAPNYVADKGQALASLFAIIIFFGATLLAQHGARKIADRMAGFPQQYQHRRAAILLILSRIIPVALFFLVGEIVLEVLDGFNDAATDALTAILSAATIAWISVGIITSFLAPKRAQFRPIKLTQEDASNLYWPASFLFALLAISDSLFGMMEALSLDRSTAIIPLAIMLATSSILMIMLARHLRHRGDDSADPTENKHKGETKRTFMNLAGLAIRAIGVFCLIASLAGYHNAASYFLDGIVRSVLVIIMAIFLHLTVIELLRALKMVMGKQSQLSERETSPSAVLVFLFDSMIVIGTILLLTHLWGAFGNQIGELVRQLIFGIEIGGVSLSLIGLSIGVGVFVLLSWLTKSIQKILSDRVLPRTQLDSAAQDSLRQSLGYVGFILAAIIALSAAGVNLSNFALIASALSVGIGFGMQTIVNNFVSGLILLAERPIKVGDWVVAGGTQGYVRRISVRATEIETFDRASVIVPNAELVAQPVTNWFYKNRQGRVVINVGVAYGSDVNKVKEILLKVAHGHEQCS